MQLFYLIFYTAFYSAPSIISLIKTSFNSIHLSSESQHFLILIFSLIFSFALDASNRIETSLCLPNTEISPHCIKLPPKVYKHIDCCHPNKSHEKSNNFLFLLHNMPVSDDIPGKSQEPRNRLLHFHIPGTPTW